MVMNFLDLWFICWTSPLSYFKNDPEYLTRVSAQVFLLYSLRSSSFLVLMKFAFFISSPLLYWCPLPIFPNICKFPFTECSDIFLYLVVLFLPSFLVFRFSLLSWHIFLYQIPSLYLDCISSLPVLGFPIFFIFGEQLNVVNFYEVVNFFFWFVKFLSAGALHSLIFDVWHHPDHK